MSPIQEKVIQNEDCVRLRREFITSRPGLSNEEISV
jgi:hypothetical protein